MPIDDLEAPGFKDRIGQAKQRAKTRLLELVDNLAPSVQASEFGVYKSRFGAWRAAAAAPAFALRKIGWSGPMPYRLGLRSLDDYDLLLANSEYTRSWIRRYYNKPSEISYPPIDTLNFRPLAKQKMLLTVGRFERTEMSKRHDALIEVFRRLHRGRVMRGWKLVVCGGSDGSPASKATLADLRKASEGLPVEIEVNVPFSRLRELYGAASCYLHAMGLDRDPESAPWRFEHFGMTTVEAMAAEAIPFVFAAGGQREIVTHQKNGFLWHTREELAAQLSEFTSMAPGRQQLLRNAARERSGDFSEEMFFRRTCAMYRSLDIPCRDVNELIPNVLSDPLKPGIQ
jgi:glycosyltransferase involved in cell wall biosynthesis